VPSDVEQINGRCGRGIGSAAAIRRSQVERSVRTLLVEVADADAEDVLELTATEDREPVEALPARATDPAFRVGVRVRRLDRRPDNLDALAAQDRVESAAELAVAVVDQEARPLVAVVEIHQQVARRLRHPCRIRVARASYVLDPAHPDRDEEQHVQPPQPDRVDGEEVTEITASARRDAEESTTRAKAEAAELIVDTSAEADRMKAEADDLVAKERAEADDTLAKAKSEAENTLADARADAENTRARTQAEADEHRQRLQEELAALQEEAEARRREVEADTEVVWKERGELIDDIRALGSSLVDSATAAAARIQRRGRAGPEEETPESEAEAEPEPQEVAADESARAMPAGASRQSGDDGPREEDVAEQTAVAADPRIEVPGGVELTVRPPFGS